MFLLLKLLATPLLILLTTLAARRWGPVIGGALAGLPFISGPASIFIAILQGTGFAAAVAYSSLLGAGAACCYCLAYAAAARRHGWLPSLGVALMAYLAAAWGLKALPHHLLLGGAIALFGPVLSLAWLPDAPGRAKMRGAQPPWRLPVQMACGGLVVYLLTELSSVVGEQWSGLLLTFPVMSSLMTPFAHMAFGPKAAILTIRGLLAGFLGSSCFTLVVATSLPRLGLVPGYALAVLVSLAVSFGLMRRPDVLPGARRR